MTADTPPLPELDELTVAVRHLVNASRELGARMARQLDVNSTDVAALDLLEQHGPLGAAELAGRLGIRPASVTVLIDRLERAGHVERLRDHPDRRRITIAATPAALSANLAAWLPAILAVDDVGRTLSAEEKRVVRDYLVRVTEALDRR
jgi:DNA-binding MarR family transcriptional regulator